MQKERRQSLLLLTVLLLIGAMAFTALFNADNKYTSALPGGLGYNVLQADLTHPAFLVDGWEYYPGELLDPDALAGREEAEHIYIGQYPNFSAHLGSPYGKATYRLILENRGESAELSLWLPELLCAGRVYINSTLVGEQGALEPYRPHVVDGVYSFRADGQTEIVIQCANYTHYYSGMYYPPAVGTLSAITQMLTVRMVVYGFLCFAALALALSNLALWLFTGDKLNRYMGLLCIFFALRVCYPFLRALGAPSIRPLYALEDFCGNAVLLLAILLAGEVSGQVARGYHRKAAVPAAAGLCAVTVVFPLFILPQAPIFINSYGLILFVWKLLAGAYLLFLSILGLSTNGILSRYLLCAAGLYGLTMAASVLTANRFEPIRGAWPEEYGGFALVVGFAALMVHRGVLLAAENRRLTLHLQEEVDRKTRSLETLLAERKELLANLIHDLKNPLTAVRSYADLVRGGGVALDGETTGYLNALSDRVVAVEDRFDLLQGFSRGERGLFHGEPICLNTFLQNFHEDNKPDMELFGQSFLLALPSESLTISGDTERLRSALENLCYNAASFTPEDGVITLSLGTEQGKAVIAVSDTGVGIAPENMSRVFDRGFTNRPDGSGEGLGLYLVRAIALEHGGTVEVQSQLGKGSVFTLRLPIASNG